MGRDLNPESVEYEEHVLTNTLQCSSHQVMPRHVKSRTYFTLANGSSLREIIIQLRSFATSDVVGTNVKL
jgi:bisphosphoglycerate-dependent phosphoglycerate mutase